MKLVHAPRSLLLSSLAVFLFVPLAVITAGVFSRHVWWDLPIHELQTVGWIVLVLVAPVSWRLAMGRAGTWITLAVVCSGTCLFLFFRALLAGGTIQALWSVVVAAVCVGVLGWTRFEQKKSYFDPKMNWFEGRPQAIPGLQVRILMNEGAPAVLRVCRLDQDGLFAYSSYGSIFPDSRVELELYLGDPHHERRARIKGDVVRQFEKRSVNRLSGDWGVGVRFHPQTPDETKDFRDFLEVLRGEGYID
jgi:hypothetical protein